MQLRKGSKRSGVMHNSISTSNPPKPQHPYRVLLGAKTDAPLSSKSLLGAISQTSASQGPILPGMVLNRDPHSGIPQLDAEHGVIDDELRGTFNISVSEGFSNGFSIDDILAIDINACSVNLETISNSDCSSGSESSHQGMPNNTLAPIAKSLLSSGSASTPFGHAIPSPSRNGVLKESAQPIKLSRVWNLPPRPARGRKPKTGSSGTNRRKSGPGTSAGIQRRRPLALEEKKLVAIKRQKRLICVICHLKKEACTFDANSADGPCLRCKPGVMPCVRYRIPDTTLYREQEAPYFVFSQRWKTMDLVDITNWADDEIRTIKLSLIYLHAPYCIRVKKFIPLPGDMVDKIWTKNGSIVKHPLPPYGIANMEEAAKSVERMIEREVGNFVLRTVGDLGADELIWDTYLAAFRRANTAPTTREQALLFDTLRLWVTCRITSHAEHIVGDDKLGTKAVDDQESPYYGSIPPSPVLSAQLECIYYSRFLRPLSKKVLRSLMKLMEAKERRYWYTIYLVLFMILHSCSMTTRRDKEYASVIGLTAKYCNPKSIKQHNAGSTTLLAHYHLALKGGLPFKLALQGCLWEHIFPGILELEEVDFITNSARLAASSKSSWDRIRNSGAWENDFFWISQLFDQDWKPEKMD